MTNSTKIKKLTPALKRRRNVFGQPCSAETAEIAREGTGASPGIVIGRVYVYDPLLRSVPQYRIREEDVPAERQRFFNAVQDTLEQFDTILDKAKDVFKDDPLGSLFDAYRHMLKGSRLIRGVNDRIKNGLINAEAAVQGEVDAIADVFAAMDDVYISGRIADIRSVGIRILRNLETDSGRGKLHLPENAVIVARDLSVADATLVDPKNIAAFVTTDGSVQSHAALLARSMGMPAVVGVPDIMRVAQTGDVIIIDGTYGKVILCPTQTDIDLYRKYRSDFLRWKRSLKRLRSQPSVTADGCSIRLQGTIDLPHELDFLQQTGVDGIGLMRSEYLFLNREKLPDENEQFETLRVMAESMRGLPVTFRTFDIGGEKCPDMLHIPKTENPALGLRGIRYALKTRDLLKMQFRAVLRAARFGNIRILLPMVSSVEEIDAAKALFYECAEELRARNEILPERLPSVGAMIETPAAALEAGVFARHCDFLSVGTNDLVQYTLAVDRSDATVAPLFNPLHPSVLKLLKRTVDAANAAGIPVGVCGEMASNHRYSAVLIGLGIRELSMPAINIPMVKERIRTLTMSDAERYVNRLLSLPTATDVTRAFNDFEEGVRFY